MSTSRLARKWLRPSKDWLVVAVFAWTLAIGLASGYAESIDDELGNAYGKLQTTTEPIQRAFLANDCLRLLLARTSSPQYAPTRKSLANDVELLRKCTRVLVDLDQPIRGELGRGARDEQRIFDAERYCACGWLNGWSALGQLARKIPDLDTSDNLHGNNSYHRKLLWLGAEEPNSGLSLLLDLNQQLLNRNARFKQQLEAVHNVTVKYGTEAAKGYAQRLERWVAFCKTSDEPIQLRLHLAVDLPTTLGEWWVSKVASPDGAFFPPTTDKIVGKDVDEISQMTGPYSLWAIVNLQLDTWNAWHDGKVHSNPELADVGAWLVALSRDERTKFLDSEAWSSRTRKLGNYLLFRDAVADPKLLAGVVDAIANDRRSMSAKGLAGLEGPARKHLDRILDAATPVKDGTYLEDAAIWLRYVFLLSHRQDGGLILVGETPANLDQQWNNWKLPQERFFLKEAPVRDSDALLRWRGRPPIGHATHCIGDLTNATYEYLRFLSEVKEAERTRTDVTKYAKELRQRIRRFEVDIQSSFRVSFSGPAPTVTTGKWDTHPLWKRSATDGEQARVLRDRDTVSRRIASSLSLQHLVLRISDAGDHSRSSLPTPSVLSSLGGTSLVSDCDLYVPPQATFDQYASEIRRLATQIKTKIEAEADARQMLQDYQLKQWDGAILKIEQDAAFFALTAARHALQMAEIYERIASLDKQIKEWEKVAADAARLASENHSQASAIRLSLAVRGRDLAAAQVEALAAALEQAPQVIEQAVAGLQSMEQQLRARADQIDDENRSSFITGLIKSVVRIVGVALAPFTGGASLGIAQAVTTAIDLVVAVEEMDWSDLGSIVRNVTHIGEQAAGITTTVVSAVGSKSLKKDWADLQKQFKDSKTKIRDIEGDAKRILKEISGLDELVVAVNAAAAALPVEYKDGKLQLDLNRLPKIELKTDHDLTNALRDVLMAGGVLANNLERRVSALSSLPVLNDETLRKVFQEEFDNFVRTAPPDVLERYRNLGAKVDELKDAKTQLRTLLTGTDERNEMARRALARILGSGMVIVTSPDGQRVIAIAPDITPEMERFKTRLVYLKKNVMEGAIGELVGEIESLKLSVQKKVKEAEKAKDSAALRQIADAVANPGMGLIRQVRDKMGLLEEKLKEAKDQLEEAQLTVDAAGFEEAAADYRKKEKEYKYDASIKDVERSYLVEELAATQFQRDRALLDARQLDLLARDNRVAKAKLERDFAYEICRDQGLDPLSDKMQVEKPDLSLRHVLYRGRLPIDRWNRDILRRQCASFIGMLRWLHLLQLETSAPPETEQQSFTSYDWLATLLGRVDGHVSIDEIQRIAKDIDQWANQDIAVEVRDKLESIASVQVRSTNAIGPTSTRWSLGSLSGVRRDVELPHGLLRDRNGLFNSLVTLHIMDFPRELVADEGGTEGVDARNTLSRWRYSTWEALSRTIIARIDVSVAEAGGLPLVAPGEDADVFMVARDVDVVQAGGSVDDTERLFYIVVPPILGRLHSSGYSLPAASMRSYRTLGNPDDAELEARVKKSLFGEWHYRPLLAGPSGAWTIYLVDPSLENEASPSERQRIVNRYSDLSVRIRFPFLKVSH